MRLSVIGCGYLGAVHAVSMAKLGHTVIAIDVDAQKVESLSSGRTPFFEPGFESLLSEGLASGRLMFTQDFSAAKDAELHFLAVGTPQSTDSNAADLSYVHSAVDSLIPHLAEGALLVGKSTVPVGTAEELASLLLRRAPHARIAWNPEFLREGFAVQDTLSPDRLVYGVPQGDAGAHATESLDLVYAEVLANGTPRIVTDYATAELVKVAANAFLATKISFINAMAEISERVGADVTQLADAIGHDARIGRRFLNAGVGFGGGCLPKDIRAFAARAEELGVGDSVSFLHEVDAINLRRRSRVVDIVSNEFGGNLEGHRIAVLGASFKPDSDDVRDSPALDIAHQLKASGASVVVTDPQAITNARAKHPELQFEPEMNSALVGAEAVLLLTEWQEYRELNPVRTKTIVSAATQPIIVDGRNCLDPLEWKAAGWKYFGLGR